jgi:unsaturated rhamnogalacturonyl hydrolase
MNDLNYTKNEITDLIDKVLSKLINEEGSKVEALDYKMNIWEWESGVALFAIYLYYKETKQKNLFDYMISWYETQFKKGLPPKNVNTVCPLLALSFIYEETKNKKYLELFKEWLKYVMEEMPRTEENGLQHIVANSVNEGQLWDDTLYMSVLFLCRMGKIFNNEAYIQESIRQFLVHLKYLTDVKTGLLFHGWGFKEKSHFAGALWGRGNGWYGAALVDYLDMTELPGGVKDFLLSSFERQVDKLAEFQSENGLWHTLLDDHTSYCETSASAAFCYSIMKGMRKGYLSDKYKDVIGKGVKAVIDQIDVTGFVQGVSYGTAIGFNLEHYKEIAIRPQPYGQTLTMLMLVELLKHI